MIQQRFNPMKLASAGQWNSIIDRLALIIGGIFRNKMGFACSCLLVAEIGVWAGDFLHPLYMFQNRDLFLRFPEIGRSWDCNQSPFSRQDLENPQFIIDNHIQNHISISTSG
jgi:hypothetical protein